MEDRVESTRDGRPGAALLALAAIVVITAGWWALALWPVGAAEPEWLARTRSACFGSHGGGLPDAGGWVLLIGEPLGMLAVLAALWRESLRSNLAWLWQRRVWRAGSVLAVMSVVAFFSILGIRVSRAQAASPAGFAANSGVMTRVNLDVPSARLVDQHGSSVDLSNPRRGPILLTFAYGHCATVCPSIVNELRMVRRESRRPDVRIVILTVDPWRDVPERLPMLSEHWKLEGGDVVLSGDVKDVEASLDKLGIGRKRNEVTGDIDHGSTVMLLDGNGRIRVRIDGGGRADFEAALRNAAE
ncbi:MAG TPA: SCO family protein [Gemmatimonadaceae bacterium]|nr:SCO family protein [Gemmatimonadaceae bacterium]